VQRDEDSGCCIKRWGLYFFCAPLQGHPADGLIGSTNPYLSRIFIIRFILNANTCRLIFVFTLGSVFIRECVASIHAFGVPNGCSTVQRRNIARAPVADLDVAAFVQGRLGHKAQQVQAGAEMTGGTNSNRRQFCAAWAGIMSDLGVALPKRLR
jgi:hypothetical protein